MNYRRFDQSAETEPELTTRPKYILVGPSSLTDAFNRPNRQAGKVHIRNDMS
jgi:hypothetical protein